MAFYMLVGSFFPRTDFSQLVKLANIMEHYGQHQADQRFGDAQLSLVQFLEIHFVTPDEHQQFPGHEHGDLPFHTVNTLQHYTADTFPGLPRFEWVSTRIVHQFFYAALSFSNFSDGIFHPPVMG